MRWLPVEKYIALPLLVVLVAALLMGVV